MEKFVKIVETTRKKVNKISTLTDDVEAFHYTVLTNCENGLFQRVQLVNKQKVVIFKFDIVLKSMSFCGKCSRILLLNSSVLTYD